MKKDQSQVITNGQSGFSQDDGGDPGPRVFESALQGQQLELVYAQAPVALMAAFAVSLLVSIGLWSVVEHSLILVWTGAQFLQTVVRLVLVFLYRTAGTAEKEDRRWSLLFIAGALVSGIIWGCVGLFLDVSWPVEYQVLTIMCLAGILAGAISTYAVVMSIYVAFMVPTILIPSLSMLVQENSRHDVMGSLFIIFAVALLAIARNYNISVLKSLRLRKENGDLLREMITANTALEAEVTTRQCAENNLIRERQLFTDGPVTVFRLRAEQGLPVEYVSETVTQFGFDASELMEQKAHYDGIIYPGDVRRIRDHGMSKGSRNAPSCGLDYRIKRPDGDVRWVYDYTVPVKNDDGEVTHYAGYIIDITDRKYSEFELQQEKERAQVTLHSIADAVITTDVNGQIEYLNPRAEQMTGWESGIARGLSVSRVFCLFDEESRMSVEEPVTASLTAGKTIVSSRDSILKRHDGSCFTVQFSASPIVVDSGAPLGMILVFHDVTEARDLEQKVAYQLTHDGLTGLINRTEFELQLGHTIAMAHKAGECHVLAHLDIDQLKLVNDTCCHEAGDELIREVTGILTGCLRESDLLASLGGDEFGVLMKNCSLEDATRIVEGMLAAIHGLRFLSCERSFDTSASIGIAKIDSGCESATHVMSEAGLACQASKELGGNRFHIYQSSDQNLVQRHKEMRWVSRVTEAIESDNLVLYYQDIMHIGAGSGGGLHFEVLVRMRDEDGGIITPNIFLPAAERYNLITSLDRWVVRHSLGWYAAHCNHDGAAGSTNIMAINLSGASITDTAFLDFIKEELGRTGVAPEVICFEITETAAVANLDAAAGFVRELRQMGCRFALDDFGSGLSSFAYLKNLPVDYLKIDGSFVKDMESDAVNRAMVNSIHQLGSVIGIKTIAEFVENEAILKMLAEIGVDYAQGYVISRPMPLDEMDVGSKLTACVPSSAG
jgi:diguanylate cyclase (GGDEF)-like protein/PAS domain S-box-containing protein